jgi:hypothetical protein
MRAAADRRKAGAEQATRVSALYVFYMHVWCKLLVTGISLLAGQAVALMRREKDGGMSQRAGNTQG